jgi:eukaryotic-like serine/threonine-protein kinase
MPVAPFHPDLLTDEDFPVPFGRYRLLGVLGEGGMARVFRAELAGPEGFRKPVAIKIIRGTVAARGESLRLSLIQEARLGGLLSHGNIVSTLDFGEQDGHLFIAMELVEGWTLADALERTGALPPELALEVAAQICDGLDHAHNLADQGEPTNLVHRDLKPSNVIIDTLGRVLVMDFGIAKATNQHGNTTADGMTKGTPTYMSPEQARGHAVDRRSDLFVVGALLYELVTGARMFGGDTLAAVLYSVIEVEARLADPRTLEHLSVAPGLDAIVTRCLRVDPEARYPDAAALEAELRAVQDKLGRGPRLRDWVRTTLVPSVAAAPTQVPPTRLLGGESEPPSALDDDTPVDSVVVTRRPMSLLVAGVLLLLLMGLGVRGLMPGEGTPVVDEPDVAEVAVPEVTPAVAEGPTPSADLFPPESTPEPRPEATPAPVVRPEPTPAVEVPQVVDDPIARLHHRPPKTVTVGVPVQLTLRIDPASTACAPVVLHGPFTDGRRHSTLMTSRGGGRWDVEVPVPYEESYRTGLRYVILCAGEGGQPVEFPGTAGGVHNVQALAR